MNSTYVSGKIAQKILGVHQRTLYQWDKKKLIDTIRTEGGKRLYNVKKYLENKELKYSNLITQNNHVINNLIQNIKKNYIYARVSSVGQKDDLERQVELLKSKYPDYNIITDIGSGINLNRRGLLKLINLSIEGKINKIVVVHKDRLCRFGYELIEFIVDKYSNGEIIILENNNKKKDLKEEIVDDMLQIMNIFVAKINGMRKYKKIESKS